MALWSERFHQTDAHASSVDYRLFQPYDTLTIHLPEHHPLLFVVRANPDIASFHPEHARVLFLETPDQTRKNIATTTGTLNENMWHVTHLLFAPSPGYGQLILDKLTVPYPVRTIEEAYMKQPLNTTPFERRKTILNWLSVTGALPPIH